MVVALNGATLDERLAGIEQKAKALPLERGNEEATRLLDAMLLELADARLLVVFLRQQLGSAP